LLGPGLPSKGIPRSRARGFGIGVSVGEMKGQGEAALARAAMLRSNQQ